MRSLVRDALIQDTTLNVPTIVSGDADSIQERPFINLQWGENNTGLAHVTRRFLVVWFHDEPSDYARIDRMVARVRAVLTAIAGREAPEGGWVTAIEWVTDSGDLRDTDRNTILRTSTYVIVGSGM